MDALEAMRTIGACRRYKPDDVPDEVIHRAAESARFAPQGGNRQPVRLVVVRERATKERLRDLYLVPWTAYYEAALAGAQALGEYGSREKAVRAANEFAHNLAEIPLLIVVLARRDALHITDLELDRPSVVGGASIYPYVQNLCIALRVEGVATAVTTLAVEAEPQVKDLLGVSDEYLMACMMAAGYPERGFPRKLSRLPVAETVFLERFGESIGTPD
ncbi:MAG TPA: nitroreductase family protein [Solirubrobacterales bacterium]|nr:nitroreductase family protein [Solirubrobacterales bacterium]